MALEDDRSIFSSRTARWGHASPCRRPWGPLRHSGTGGVDRTAPSSRGLFEQCRHRPGGPRWPAGRRTRVAHWGDTGPAFSGPQPPCRHRPLRGAQSFSYSARGREAAGRSGALELWPRTPATLGRQAGPRPPAPSAGHGGHGGTGAGAGGPKYLAVAPGRGFGPLLA